MRRYLARFVFVFVIGTIAMILGVITSMTLTPPGRDLLARTVSRGLDRIVTGQVKVGAISGCYLRSGVITREPPHNVAVHQQLHLEHLP